MTTAQSCYDLVNDPKDFVGYRNNKLYYDASGVKTGNSIDCLGHRTGTWNLGAGLTNSDSKFMQSQSNNDYNVCDDNAKEFMRNMPTMAFLDSSGYLRGNLKCLRINDNNELTDETSFTMGGKKWALDSTTSYGNNRLRHNNLCLEADKNKSVSLKTCNPNGTTDLGQQWISEGQEMRNLLTNECLNPQGRVVQKCMGSAPNNKWEFDGKLLKNKGTGQCLDGNGSSIYTGGCSASNPYQHWSIEGGGTKIKHGQSGKCIKRRVVDKERTGYGGFVTKWKEVEMYLDKCDCSADMATNSTLRTEYTNYIKNNVADCANASDFKYNSSTGKCSKFIYGSPTILANFNKWCDQNQSNSLIAKQCASALSRTVVASFNIFCPTGKDIIEKPMCTAMLNTKAAYGISNEDLQYMKARYNESLATYCVDNMSLNDAGLKTIEKKYTTDVTEDDEGCISNWDYVRPDGTKLRIKSATNVGDTSYWCRKAKGPNDPLYKCHAGMRYADIKNGYWYGEMNTAWRSIGATRDIPIHVFYKYDKPPYREGGSYDVYWPPIHMREDYIKTLTKDSPESQIFWLFGCTRVNDLAPTVTENGKYRAISSGTGRSKTISVTEIASGVVRKYRQTDAAACTGSAYCQQGYANADIEAAKPNVAIVINSNGVPVEVRKDGDDSITSFEWVSFSGLDNKQPTPPLEYLPVIDSGVMLDILFTILIVITCWLLVLRPKKKMLAGGIGLIAVAVRTYSKQVANRTAGG
jgi:hypothetical protein